MFGYVRVFLPVLKVKENELYNGIYCSLCKRLGKRYGWMSRMTLSYDFTFLAVLKAALADESCQFEKCRCPAHPFKKKTCCRNNDSVSFAADAAVITVYYKCLDSIRDDGWWSSLPSRLLLPFARRAKKRAAVKHPELDAVLAREMQKQAELERDAVCSIDAAAEPTATMLSAILMTGEADDKQRRILERLGYCLGRWVYLIDAIDDLEDDLKRGNYNPYVLTRHLSADDMADIQATREYALLTLNACLAECAAAYDLLSVKRFDGILRNVLSCGMAAQQHKVIHRNKEINDEHEKSV